MSNAVRFKYVNVPRQQGELARLKVVQGPDYGAIYVIIGQRATIGRGEECDIFITDLKASRLHAEIFASASGWIVRDKSSANGILHNGKQAREAVLKLSDVITIGETTLEFTTSEAGTSMLVAPPRSIEQIHFEQKNLNDRKNKLGQVGLAALFGGGDLSAAGGGAAGKKNSIIILISGAIMSVLFLIPNEDEKRPKAVKKANTESIRDLASYLPKGDTNKTSEAIFKEGFREYLTGNFNRARTQFETVLQISPGHALASIYLENCNKAINKEVKFHLDYGKKAHDSGKLKDAQSHYERIIRLLYRDQANPSFKEATENLEKVKKDITGGGSGTS
jgi:pSer/pThr/pTyr-binding forkhead associated (FHA) protein